MPEGQAIEWVLIPIGFLGALVYGVTGFGSVLVTIPLATHFVPLPFALAVFVLQDFSSAVRVATERPPNALKAEVVRMVPIMIVGSVLGAKQTVGGKHMDLGVEGHQIAEFHGGRIAAAYNSSQPG